MADAAKVINLIARIVRIVLKVVGITVGGVLGLVLIVLIAVNFLLQTGFFTDIVLSQALPPVEELLCADLHVDKLRLSLVPFSLQLEGARFTDREGKYDYPFATLDSLTVKVKTLPLLSGTVVVKELSLRGASNYLLLRDGLENLPMCPATEEPEEEEEEPPSDEPFRLELPIVVENLHLDASFRMDMPATTPEPTPEDPEPAPGSAMNVSVAEITLDGKADLRDGDANVELRVKGGDFTMGEMHDTIDLVAIDATANLQEWIAKVARLDVELPLTKLAVTAEATDLLGELDLSADVKLDTDLRKVNQLVLTKPEDMQLSGPVALTTNAKLHLGKEKMTYAAGGELSLPDARVNELPIQNLLAKFMVTSDHAKLERLTGRIGTGVLDVIARIGLQGAMPLNAQVKIAGLDVGDAIKKFGLAGVDARGLLDTELTANGNLSPMALDTKGTVSLADAGYGTVAKTRQVDIELDANVGGTDNLVRSLRLTALDTMVAGSLMPQVTLDLAGNFGAKVNQIDKLQLTTMHSEIDVSGTADLSGPLAVKVKAELNDLGEFSGFVGGKKLAGRGLLEAEVGGTTKKPDVTGHLQFADLIFDKMEVGAINAGLGFKNDKAVVENLLIEAGAAVIKADAAYDMSVKPANVSAKLSLPSTKIAELIKMAGMADSLEVAGDAELTVDVAGPVDALSGKVLLKADKVEAFKEKVEALTLNARLDDGVVVLDDLSIVKQRSIRPIFKRGLWRPKPEDQVTEEEKLPAVIRLTGRVDPKEKTFSIKLLTEHLTEMASDTVARERIHAMADVELNADLTGTFDNPGGALRLAIAHGRYEHLDLGNSTIDIKIVDQQVKVTGALLAGRQTVSLEERLQAETEPTVVEQIRDRVEPLLPGHEEKNEDDPDFAAAEARMTPSEQTEPEQPPVDLGRIEIDATLGLRDEMPLEARVTFAAFDYSNFLKSYEQVRRSRKEEGDKDEEEDEEGGPEQEVFGGRIAGEILVTGLLAQGATAAAPEGEKPPTKADINATVRFEELLFQRNEFVIRNQNEAGQTVPILVHYRNGNVDVESFALGGKGVKITLDRMDKGEPFLALDAAIELALAKVFTDALADAKGDLTIHAEIPVKFDMDKVLAEVKIPEGTFAVRNMPAVIENFTLDIRFAHREATIKKLSANLGGGTLSGGGTVRLPADEPEPAKGEKRIVGQKKASGPQVDLIFKIDNVKTGFDPYLEVAINKVELLVTNRPDGKLDVSGEVRIDKAVYSQDFDLAFIIKQFQKPRGAVSGSETYEKKEESVFFNIVIHAPRNIAFDSNNANIEVKLDLILTGSNVEMGMIGTVEVLKGWATVLQNDYRLTSAVIQFFDERRIYPTFDINAATEVNEIQIFINISGTPDRYKISFQSDPPKTERDIVTLLSLGVSYEEFQSSGGGISTEEALSLAAQQAIGSRFRSYTGLDFGVDSSTGTSRFRISGELEKDLRLSIFRGIADPTLAAELEYGFIRYMAVYTDWSNFAGQEDVPPSGGYGAGVRIKIDFR
ncbi:MAG TPA: translocation/assembly module TamB domain-containing protein [bacterium]|nr:translocation/assembly module TamB domain-containing protein [bacterium]